MGHHPDVRFGADFSAQKVSKADLVGFDLCVLATSHHSVHTYGTFGLWGSLLAGGDVVVTKGRVEVGLPALCNLVKSLPMFCAGGFTDRGG